MKQSRSHLTEDLMRDGMQGMTFVITFNASLPVRVWAAAGIMPVPAPPRPAPPRPAAISG